MHGTNDPFEQMEAMFEQMRRNALGSLATQRRSASGEAGRRRQVGQGQTGSGHPEAETTLPSEGTHDAALTLEETDDGYLVVADVPGFEREEIDLTYDEGVLTIEGTHEVTDEATYRQRTIAESVRIPGDVVVDDVSATYRNGVLEVSLPADVEESDAIHIDVE